MTKLREITVNDFSLLKKSLKRDFSFYEYMPLFLIKRCLKKKTMTGYFLCDVDIIGYALLVTVTNSNYIHLQNIAITPEYRSKGYGSDFMKKLMDRYPNRTFILEVLGNISKEVQDTASSQRIRFYERLGFSIISQSKYKIAGKEITVMVNGICDNYASVMSKLYKDCIFPGKQKR